MRLRRGALELEVDGGANVLGLTLTDVLGTFNVDLILAASEANSLIKVISAPKVTTQDNPARVVVDVGD